MTHVLLPEALRWRITGDRHDVASERSHYTCRFIERKCVETIEYELVPSLRRSAHHQPDGEERSLAHIPGGWARKLRILMFFNAVKACDLYYPLVAGFATLPL